MTLSWYLSIEATLAVTHEGILYPELIRFYHEVLRFPEQPRHWKNLVGQIIQWDEPDDVSVQVSRPSFYLQAHQDVSQGLIEFVERNDCSFRVVWKGNTDSYGAFLDDTWLSFESIEIFGAENNVEANHILANYMEPNDFEQQNSNRPLS